MPSPSWRVGHARSTSQRVLPRALSSHTASSSVRSAQIRNRRSSLGLACSRAASLQNAKEKRRLYLGLKPQAITRDPVGVLLRYTLLSTCTSTSTDRCALRGSEICWCLLTVFAQMAKPFALDVHELARIDHRTLTLEFGFRVTGKRANGVAAHEPMIESPTPLPPSSVPA